MADWKMTSQKMARAWGLVVRDARRTALVTMRVLDLTLEGLDLILRSIAQRCVSKDESHRQKIY
jgi:hypothetical protein